MRKRQIQEITIKNKIIELVKATHTVLPRDVVKELKSYMNKVKEKKEKDLLKIILKNAELAKEKNIALCQDTGISIFFVEIGRKTEIIGKRNNIEDIINIAVKSVYSERKLRPSILDDPLEGKNLKYNLPAFISTEYNDSDQIKISFLAKGGGSENASAVTVLNPSDGFEGIENFVIDTVINKGINSCPPLILGLAFGGTIDHAALAAKKALLRKIGQRHPKPYYAKRERSLKKKINHTGIGVMGLGGECTVLDVFIQELPRHIASLPVAISILCHSARRGEIVIWLK